MRILTKATIVILGLSSMIETFYYKNYILGIKIAAVGILVFLIASYENQNK